jgi:arylsulfatase A-like enzyme
MNIQLKIKSVQMAAAAMALCTNASCNKEHVVQHPNVLYIMVDDLGYGDLSFNGGTDIQTPHIDDLFASGATLSRFYANSTVCSPTRAAMLTGCYPDMSGVPGVIRTHEENSWGYFREDLPTLPDMLKRAGYHTALIGKWHLGLESPNMPNERGFDHFHGFLGDMMDDYWNHLRHDINYMRLNEQQIHPEGHATDLFSDWAIDYLETASASTQPFFLFLSYNAPHFPIQPPGEWLQRVKDREGNITNLRANNVAFVEHMDHGIGRVLAALQQTGLDKNTIVIFTSDNGGSLPHGASNGILRGGKQNMYEGGIKAPTCFIWPGKIKQGSVANMLGLTMDLFPTLCEVAGIPVEHHIDGISLLPRLIGKEQETNDRIVYFMRREGGSFNGLCYYAARNDRYKLIQNTPFEPLQLFDMLEDPLETQPLPHDHPAFSQLKNALAQHIRRSGAVPWQK